MATWKWICLLAAAVVLRFLVPAALVLILVLALKGGDDSNPLAPEEGRAFSPVEGSEAGELAERFRPWLMFDSEERWRPQSIPSLLAERRPSGRPLHEFCKGEAGRQSECQPVGGIAEFEALIAENGADGDHTYLDVGKYEGQYREPERSVACRESGLLDCDDQPDSAIYYNVTSSNERFYIDYWWFLRFNHFDLTNCSFEGSGVCDEHEGDWEGVTLVTAPEDAHTLDYVVYAAHKGTFRYPAKQLGRHGLHPVVYVADGSHASYPRPCDALIACSQPNVFGGVAHVPETNIDGRRPWARNDDRCVPGDEGSCLLPLPVAEPGQSVWTSWAGLWGGTCGKRCQLGHPQSPASPGLQNRFQHPWCSTQGARQTCDSVAQGCSDWLGPLVSVLACNPGAIARGLQAPEELPSGGLTLTVTSPSGEKRKLSASTRGVVQALGTPLTPGSKVVVGDAGEKTEILVRAIQGNRLLEARFSPFEAGLSGRSFEIVVSGTESGAPALHATRGDGTVVDPEEQRRVRLKQG
jgi:hypothetical protein